MYRLSTPYNASLKSSSGGYNFIQDQQRLFPQAILCVWEAFALNFTVSQSANRCSAAKGELFQGNLRNNFSGWQAILNNSQVLEPVSFIQTNRNTPNRKRKGGGGKRENDIFLGFHLVFSFICWHNNSQRRE